jgi:hypothetical protein
MTLPLIFSSPEYYKNYNFVRLLRNWNTYLNSDEPREQVLVEWEEILLIDFLESSKEWLYSNRSGNVFWKVGLE